MSILARPNYKTTLTPRFDPFPSAGMIRGSPPNLIHTAVQPYPILPELNSLSQSDTVNQQYEIPYILKKINKKNDPLYHEYFYEKINLSSTFNKMYSVDELIDAPEVVNPSEFSKLGDMNSANVRKETKPRPDLSYQGATLPKLGIENKFKDPTDPSNYMYDRTLFAPLKRRNGGVGTDYIRGDIYVAPAKFGWFDVPANPGTDLNPGFFNLNYPSFESTVEKQDVEVKRQNKGLTLEELESIQRNNPFATNSLHRP
jgi:hypothetical protein